MRLKIYLLIISFFMFSSLLMAQTNEFESTETPQTIKIIEFGVTSDCEKSAIVDSMFIELNNIPNATAYIIVYRGLEDLPSRHTNDYVQEQFNWISQSIAFRKYDSTRITLIDGGFRKSAKVVSEVWIVPQGGIIPQPTETVEQPQLVKDKTFLADKDFYNSAIESAFIVEQDYEIEPQEIDTDPSETENVEVEETETENIETQETFEELVDEEETEEYLHFSKYFGVTLQKDSTLKGTIIYYADAETYDLAKAQSLMEEKLRKFTAKYEINPNRINLIYGGYRENTDIEYWIVPKDAKEPQPKPEVKKIEENK